MTKSDVRTLLLNRRGREMGLLELWDSDMNLIKLLFSLTLFIFITPAYSIDACVLDSGNIINTSVDTSDGCSIQPEIQRVKFYKLALCSSEPIAPTDASAVDISNCITIWENSSGSTIDILKNTFQPLSGGSVNIPVGTFSYFYLEIDPVIGIQAQRNFNFIRSGSTSDDAGSGTTCWSVSSATPFYSATTYPLVAEGTVKCGTEIEADPGVTNTFINEGDDDFTGTFVTSQGFTFKYFLVKNNYILPVGLPVVDSTNDLTKIIGWGPQSLSITSTSAKIQINFNNSQGGEIFFSNNAGEIIDTFGPGPFDIFVNIVN